MYGYLLTGGYRFCVITLLGSLYWSLQLLLIGGSDFEMELVCAAVVESIIGILFFNAILKIGEERQSWKRQLEVEAHQREISQIMTDQANDR